MFFLRCCLCILSALGFLRTYYPVPSWIQSRYVFLIQSRDKTAVREGSLKHQQTFSLDRTFFTIASNRQTHAQKSRTREDLFFSELIVLKNPIIQHATFSNADWQFDELAPPAITYVKVISFTHSLLLTVSWETLKGYNITGHSNSSKNGAPRIPRRVPNSYVFAYYSEISLAGARQGII